MDGGKKAYMLEIKLYKEKIKIKFNNALSRGEV